MAGESAITLTRTVDNPVSIAARYFLDAVDRRYLDNQIRGTQRHVVDSLLSGVVATWSTLSGASAAVVAGDWVVPEPGSSGKFTKATNALLTDSGVAAGLVLDGGPPGGSIRVALAGIVPASITGLAIGSAGPVRVNTTTARSQKVAALGATDVPVGYVDSLGNLSLSRIPRGVAGGGSGSLPVASAAGQTIVWNGADYIATALDPTDADGFVPGASGTVLVGGATASWSSSPTVTGITLSGTNFRYAAAAVAPSIVQVDDATAGVTADDLTIQAQNATGTGSTVGGSLNLKAGTGNTMGVVNVYGSTDILCTFKRNPALLDFITASAIAFKGTPVIGFFDSTTKRNLGLFNDGTGLTTEDLTIRIGTVGTAPPGTVNGGSFLWAAGTNGLELRTHTYTAITAVRSPYIALGTTPSAATSGVCLSNNTGITARNSGNTSDIDVLIFNGSNNILLGNDATSVVDMRALSNCRFFSGGVQSAQLGRASGDFIRIGGTAYAGTGLIRTVHGSTILVALNNAGSADRNILSFGVGATDRVDVGNSATVTAIIGSSTTINGAGGITLANAVVASSSLSVTGTINTAGTPFFFNSTVASPVINQQTDTTASVTGDLLTVHAQDCSGTTSVTAGALLVRAGNATGGSGTRNGGKATFAGGTGADTNGDLALNIKGADFLTCVSAATPYIRLDGHDTATTVGAAGAGAALPATPTAYLRISLAGTRFKIPYYAD